MIRLLLEASEALFTSSVKVSELDEVINLETVLVPYGEIKYGWPLFLIQFNCLVGRHTRSLSGSGP